MEDRKSLCSLNRYKLDEEAEKAAAILQNYGQDLAKARIKVLRAELALSTIKYAAELAIRKSDPKKFGLEKFTEGSITALVETDIQVVEAKKNYLDAKEEQVDLEPLVEGLREKCDQIKNEISLWIGGYFAEPANNGNRKKEAMGKQEN